MTKMKFAEWDGGAGRWRVGFFWKSAVPEKWYVAWRFTKLPFDKYIELLKKYKAENFSYYPPTDCLLFDFSVKTSAHKFVLEMNKRIRNERWEYV